MLNLNYDEKYDVLYIGLSDRSNSLGDDEYGGLVVFRDEFSDNITGLTVFGFFEKYKKQSLPKWPDGISIDTEREILPYIAKHV